MEELRFEGPTGSEVFFYREPSMNERFEVMAQRQFAAGKLANTALGRALRDAVVDHDEGTEERTEAISVALDEASSADSKRFAQKYALGLEEALGCVESLKTGDGEFSGREKDGLILKSAERRRALTELRDLLFDAS